METKSSCQRKTSRYINWTNSVSFTGMIKKSKTGHYIKFVQIYARCLFELLKQVQAILTKLFENKWVISIATKELLLGNIVSCFFKFISNLMLGQVNVQRKYRGHWIYDKSSDIYAAVQSANIMQYLFLLDCEN